MSLPFPSSSPPGSSMSHFHNMSASEQQAWDAPLLALTQKSGGDLRRLLFAFFSFLNRRTDFYMIPNELDEKEGIPSKMGFKNGDAEKLLLASFRQFPLRKMPRVAEISKAARPSTAESNDGESPGNVDGSSGAGTTDSTGQTEKGAKDTVESKLTEKMNSLSSHTEQNGSPSSTNKKSKKKENDKKEGSVELRYTEEGKQIPVGNGGSTDRYKWTQTINEVSIALPLPDGITRGKDLDIVIKSNSISVKSKKSSQSTKTEGSTLLEGVLAHKIRTDESTWSLEGGILLLTLDKIVHTWWESVLEGETEVIDTSLIDSKRNIAEYDDATQGMIRKILFDQRQERLGLPTSDEIIGKGKGTTGAIPNLPRGVEYIDKSKF